MMATAPAKAVTAQAGTNLPALVADKPMNQTQLKNLQRLVDLDFSALHETVFTDIEMRASKRRQQIEAKHSGDDKSLEKARKRLATWEEKVRLEAGRLQEDLTTEGFGIGTASTVTLALPGAAAYNLNRVGKQQELTRVTNAATRLKSVAALVINSEKRKIDRVVLLQGITGEGAQDIINDMPDPKDVFNLIQQEMSDYQDDIAEIMGDD